MPEAFPNLEQMLTLREIAKAMQLSFGTVQSLFEKQPGVVVIDRPEQLHKRKYRTFRVPRHVCERVVRRLSK
jgi:hypothetical protein